MTQEKDHEGHEGSAAATAPKLLPVPAPVPASSPSSASSPAAEGPQQLRDEVAQTREDLGDTVAQLAAKADLKQQARDKVEQVKLGVRTTTAQAVEAVLEKTPEAVHDAAQAVRSRRGKVVATAAAGVGAVLALTPLLRRRLGRKRGKRR